MILIPLNTSPIKEAKERPITWPNGPKRLVPMRYDIEAGRKAVPCSRLVEFMRPIIQMGSEGSRTPMLMFAKVMAPVGHIR